MAADVQAVTLAIILGTLLAIVYSIRILVLLERRIARIDHHIELMAMTILKDEEQVLAEEARIEALVRTALKEQATNRASSSKKSSKKSTKKTTKKKASKKSSKKKSKK